jgi:hypothetical protein
MNVVDPKLVNMCRKEKDKSKCRENFHQPGALSGDRFALNAPERRRCDVLKKLMKSDVPEMFETSFYQGCPNGKSMIAAVVHDNEDYHFYRLDSDGYWSHKDGSNKAKRFDSFKRAIFNPEQAGRDYRPQGSNLNYKNFCGFFCVPRNHEILLGSGGARPLVAGAVKTTESGFDYRQKGVGLSWTDHRRQTRRKQRAA